MKFSIKYHNIFKKDLKAFKNNTDLLDELFCVIEKLASDEILETKYKDHPLKGNFKGCRECHVKGDVLFMYEKNNQDLILYCLRFGSHSKLGLK